MPSSRGSPDSGIELTSLTSPELAGELFITSAIWEARIGHYQVFIIKTSHWVPCLENHCLSVVQHLRCWPHPKSARF